MSGNLLSIRMHASLEGKHLSGAERLVEELSSAEEVMLSMLQRALDHPRGTADRISLQVDEIFRKETVKGTSLEITGYQVEDWLQGRELAQNLLVKAGVSLQAACSSLEFISKGAAPDGTSMRGAMLIDASSGERLEADQARGIRVSRMDLEASVRSSLRQKLAELSLDNPHVIEALTLASKVLSTPGIIAEICWSDDPDYLAGYVSSVAAGYQRISHLKPQGNEKGGRAFFVQQGQEDLTPLIQYLERTPFLIDRIGKISKSLPWPEYS